MTIIADPIWPFRSPPKLISPRAPRAGWPDTTQRSAFGPRYLSRVHWPYVPFPCVLSHAYINCHRRSHAASYSLVAEVVVASFWLVTRTQSPKSARPPLPWCNIFNITWVHVMGPFSHKCIKPYRLYVQIVWLLGRSVKCGNPLTENGHALMWEHGTASKHKLSFIK